jgi:phage shock protein C
MKPLIAFFEERTFGVCTFLGEKFGIASASIRLFFLYTSFITFGSPLIIYLAVAFVLNIHKHLRRSRSAIWDF